MKYDSASQQVGVRVGGIYNIHPSQAYLGIQSGQVKVLEITDALDNFEVKNAVKEQIDCICLDVNDSEDIAIITHYHESKWVKYEYMHPKEDKIWEGSEIQYMDLETFLNHITVY